MKNCIVYTDGSCSPNPGKGGWSAIVEFNNKRIELGGKEECSTNNRMEIAGIMTVLPILSKYNVKNITLITDSKYVCLGIENKIKWQKKLNLINKDLWDKIYECMDECGIVIETKWVKGHANHEMNNLCDRLACEARK